MDPKVFDRSILVRFVNWKVWREFFRTPCLHNSERVAGRTGLPPGQFSKDQSCCLPKVRRVDPAGWVTGTLFISVILSFSFLVMMDVQSLINVNFFSRHCDWRSADILSCKAFSHSCTCTCLDSKAVQNLQPQKTWVLN